MKIRKSVKVKLIEISISTKLFFSASNVFGVQCACVCLRVLHDERRIYKQVLTLWKAKSTEGTT